MIDPSMAAYTRLFSTRQKDIIINGKLINLFCNLTSNVSVSTSRSRLLPKSRLGLVYAKFVNVSVSSLSRELRSRFRLCLEEIDLDRPGKFILLLPDYNQDMSNNTIG